MERPHLAWQERYQIEPLLAAGLTGLTVAMVAARLGELGL